MSEVIFGATNVLIEEDVMSDSKPWIATQEEVWGTKDPEVFGRVVKRLQMVERDMLKEMEHAIKNGAPTHTVAWIAVNHVLRGCGSSAEYVDDEAAR